MYTVNVLSEKDFDKLPYKHAKTSLGLADAKTGVAYVRDTGYNDITKDTIAHELDELMQKTSPHEEDGIRYKNLKSLGAGAGAGILSSMIPGLRGFSPAISAGAGALAAGKGKRLQGAAQGFGGGGIGQSLGGGVFDAFKGATNNQPGGAFGRALSGFGSGIQRGGGDFIQGIPGFGRDASGTPTGSLSKFFSGQAPTQTGAALATRAGDKGSQVAAGLGVEQALADSASRTLAGPTGPGTTIGSAATSGADSTLKGGGVLDKLKGLFAGGGGSNKGGGFGDSLKNGAVGLGIAGLGDAFSPQAQVPDTSGIQARLESLLQGGAESGAKGAGIN